VHSRACSMSRLLVSQKRLSHDTARGLPFIGVFSEHPVGLSVANAPMKEVSCLLLAADHLGIQVRFMDVRLAVAVRVDGSSGLRGASKVPSAAVFWQEPKWHSSHRVHAITHAPGNSALSDNL